MVRCYAKETSYSLFNLLLVGDLVGLVGCICPERLRDSEPVQSMLETSDADFMHLLSVGGEDCGLVGTD